MRCLSPGAPLGRRLCKRLGFSFLSVWFAVILSAGFASGAESSGSAKWARLDYSIDSWMGGDEFTARVTPGENFVFSKETGLKVDLQWLPGGGDLKKFEQLKLRLHYPDGRIVEPLRANPASLVTQGVLIAFRSYLFPFGENDLTEAWFELQAGGRTFWLEVPYGFTRNPEDPMPPSEPEGKPQGFVRAMSQMKTEDDIFRWSSVLYQFGSIQNGWNLEVSIRHGGMGGRVYLHRKEGRWAIHTPVTSLKVEMENGQSIVGEQIASRLESPNDREDEFKFDFKQLSGRKWGKLVVTVDNVRLSQVVSLGTLLQGMWIPPRSGQ